MEYEQSTTSSNTSGYSDGLNSSSSDDADVFNHLGSQKHSENGNDSSTGEDSPAMKLLWKFDKYYSVCGLNLFFGPLDDALMTALTDSIPLILLLHNDKSVAANIFCRNVLRFPKIRDYLAEKFIVWGWDRTNDNNDDQFENMLKSQIGDQITASIMRVAVDSYPLLLCITLQHGQLQIIGKISGTMSCNEVYQKLLSAHDKFDRRIETFNMSKDSSLVFNDFLTILLEDSIEYDEIANKLAIAHRRILRIYNIDVPDWSIDYTHQKAIIDARIAADNIIQHGFDHDLIGQHGTSFGHGFYFSSCSTTCQDYAKADPPINGRAILICHVIVGESRIGNSSMRKCPDGYDSTTDGLHTTYVVYSNEQILPKYLVIYE
ncbi:unnamed protein product [Adineta steineri]|uniref:Poly [ADP-ribose] polymerase n=1 Tax=Adineta steineri TaxID=433720 RepID=A0A815DTM6_9BILA|nr:unnamed protein product [Adineta steineri]CAF1497390.1 unnamed protein product [Adineta steineri]